MRRPFQDFSLIVKCINVLITSLSHSAFVFDIKARNQCFQQIMKNSVISTVPCITIGNHHLNWVCPTEKFSILWSDISPFCVDIGLV